MRSRTLLALLGALGLAGAVYAQIEGGDRGVAPVDSSGDYEVSDITVDVAGKTADAARLGGWRIAQRKGWAALSKRLGGGGPVSDGTLDAIVSGIVVQNEQISPTRYIARLGVLFDRDRASAILGIASYSTRSPAMVVIPVQWTGGAAGAFEVRSPWQEAWARYRTGGSTIDYIRPTGTGPDALLLNVGQTGRPGRGWWRHVLGEYGGVDVLVPVVKLTRQWPGGPVVAQFEARHGPDNRLLGSFALRVASAGGLPALLDEGVKRIDELYQNALRSGYLATDKGLTFSPNATVVAEEVLPTDSLAVEPTAGVVSILVQFDSPAVGAVTSTESAMRGIPGVGSAATTSLALGGTSIMSVSFGGPPEAFKQALEARGWQVFGTGTALRIRRAPQLLPPDLSPDNSTAG
jgi:hypothetical protein